LHFVPPPLEGTISLGIFDATGKLVRVLHREDEISDFTAGHDALETTWDGKDDSGHPLAAGRYHARGFLLGGVQVEGVGYFFNDWVTDEHSPHIARVTQIEANDSSLRLTTTLAGGATSSFLFDPATGMLAATDAPAAKSPSSSAALIDPVAVAPGRDGTIWAISHAAKNSAALEIVQLASQPIAGVLRKLAIAPNDPQPFAIAASPNEERIFLLERSPSLERLRSLTLLETKAKSGGDAEAVSNWKIDFEKKIVAHENFALQNGAPVAMPNEKVKSPDLVEQILRPNSLERDRRDTVKLAAGFDAEGAFLKTADGLPLRTVSDNAQIKRIVIAPRENGLDFFQDDGAVVEQFRLSRLDQMMAFDCGAFDLK
jgi:hypothetical protein